MYGLFMCFEDQKELVGTCDSHMGMVLIANTTLESFGLHTTWDDDLRVSADIDDPEVPEIYHYEIAVSVEEV